MKIILSKTFYLILFARRGNFAKDIDGNCFFHMYYANNPTVTGSTIDTKLEFFLRSPYSPELSLCDFRLLGMLRHKMKDQPFLTVEACESSLGTRGIGRPPIRLL
jgi:hypothetical protein